MPDLASEAELRSQIDELPPVPLSDERIETVRSRLLNAATQQPAPRRWWRVGLGASVLAAAAVALLMWQSGDRSRMDIAVTPAYTQPLSIARAAQTARAETKPAPVVTADEPLIIARDGRARFVHKATTRRAVAAVRVGERIVRFHGDVEIVTRAGELREIVVRTGKAEVSKDAAANAPYAVVVAGSTWRAEPRVERSTIKLPPTTRSSPPAKPSGASLLDGAPDTAADKKPAVDDAKPNTTKPTSAGLAQTPAEQAFSAAWNQLRARKYHDAALGFARALRLPGARNVAEDARYWHAVSLRRVGTSAGAMAAMHTFLQHHGSSRRAPRIRVMLGWLLLERGDKPGARAQFKRAARSPAAEVRKAANDGLRRAK